MRAKEKSIFDIIMEYSINEGLNRELLQDEEYKEIHQRMDEQTEELDAQDLTKEQRLMIDRLVCIYTENGAHYGRMTYKQGFRDCIALLREMDLIKAS